MISSDDLIKTPSDHLTRFAYSNIILGYLFIEKFSSAYHSLRLRLYWYLSLLIVLMISSRYPVTRIMIVLIIIKSCLSLLWVGDWVGNYLIRKLSEWVLNWVTIADNIQNFSFLLEKSGFLLTKMSDKFCLPNILRDVSVTGGCGLPSKLWLQCKTTHNHKFFH